MAREQEQDVTAFIALIDRWLLLTGVTYTVQQHEAPATAPSITNATGQDDIPLFVQSNVSLSDLLRDHEREVTLVAELDAQIKQACNDKELVQNTQARLTAEFAALSPSPSHAKVAQFADCSVRKQLALLRKAADTAALPPAFEVLVVKTLEPNGQVDEITTIYPHKDISWFNFTVSICTSTTSWQSTEAGFPTGYGIREGGWLYQHAHKGIPAKPVYPLNTAAHFEEMCNTMEQTDTTVLIWHERIYKESQTRKEEHAKLRDRRSVFPEDEPLNPDGTPYFDPYFDDYDWSGIDFTEELEDHKRSYGMPG